MRLLHTSDWHLGKACYSFDRNAEHDVVLAEIIELAQNYKPHLIIHSGDVWDQLRPSYLDLTRGVDALKDLAAIAPTVVICGNHDSPALFELFMRLLGREHRLHFISQAKPAAAGGVLEFPAETGEVVRLASVPFIHGNRMIDADERADMRMTNYADRVQHIEDALYESMSRDYDPKRHVLLFAAHLHVTGATMSNTERQIHVTESYATRMERLPQVSYAAFGHIHKPQKLPGTVPGRYAGSTIQLDFGEAGQTKETVTVEIAPGRPPQIEIHKIAGGRQLKRVEGTIDQIGEQADTVGNALCVVTVDTESAVLNLQEQVQELLPQAQLLAVYERDASRRLHVLGADDVVSEAEPTFTEAFHDFLKVVGTREGSADRVLSIFSSLIESVQSETEPTLPELAALEKAVESLKPKKVPAPSA